MRPAAEHIQQPIPVTSFPQPVLQVKDVFNGDEVQLKYMEQCGDYYKWPARPDLSQELCSSIKKKLPVPKLVEEKSTSMIQLFSFE